MIIIENRVKFGVVLFCMITLCACSQSLSPIPKVNEVTQELQGNCGNDSFYDLKGADSEAIDQEKILLVPLGQQKESLKMLEGNRFIPLNESQFHSLFGNVTARISGEPFLVAACFYTVKSGPRADTSSFERAFSSASFDPVYYNRKNLLFLRSYGFSSRVENAQLISVVIWHDKPIEEVRVYSGYAQ